MWAFCAQQVILRAFYAQKDTRTPLRVALCMLGLNFLLNLVFIWVPSVRHGAFGLSTSITASLNVIVLAFVLRRRLGRLGLRSLSVGIARIATATGVMALAVWGTLAGIDRLHLSSHLALAQVVGGVTAGAGAYLLMCLALRAPELGEILARPRANGAGASTE
jgi:putative peptidoglycan lipid II flippase